MNILVVGKGGREHALVCALSESPSPPRLYAFPGSDAIFETASPAKGVSDLPSLVAFLKRENIDLCVAGEESYLMLGLADACEEAGIPCWGPKKAAARLEGSKGFAKDFMARHGIPTGSHQTATSFDEAKNQIASYPCVLKFDGLAAGKGVAVCPTEREAEAFLEEVFVENRFGKAPVLIEEFLQGPEVSIFCSVVDSDYQILIPARDYKRLGDGDQGPNTGGMGAVASKNLIPQNLLDRIEREIVAPTVHGLRADGLAYRGFLYFGLMLTADGPKVIEYNCRFGDPECQAVLPLIQGDWAAYLLAAAQGRLDRSLIHFVDEWSLCVVLASHGYPQSSRSGDLITGLQDLRDARVYHAGTRRNSQGSFETAGGRVLAVVARGASRQEAVERVYREAKRVEFPGSQRRTDIGTLHFKSSD